MAPGLPFSEFLQALRARDVQVGVREHQRLLRLLTLAGDSLRRDELRAAVAALLGHDRIKAQTVREIFDAHFTEGGDGDDVTVAELRRMKPTAAGLGAVEAATAGTPGAAGPIVAPSGPARLAGQASSVQSGRRRLIQVLLASVLFAGLGLGLSRLLGIGTSASLGADSGIPDAGPSADLAPSASNASEPPDLGPPADPPDGVIDDPPDLPKLPPVLHYGKPAAAGGALFLLAALFSYLHRRRQRQRDLAFRQANEGLSALPGPHRYQLDLPGLSPPIPREDIEELAVLLCRQAATRGQGNRLDGERTTRHIGRTGLLTRLYLNPRRTRRTLLVLLDTDHHTRRFTRSITALLTGLSRQGVPLTLRYFCGSAERLAETPQGPTQPRDEALRPFQGHPLLIISTGDRVRTRSGMASWVPVLAREFPRRSWLHPAPLRQLWPSLLLKRRFPFPVRPLCRAGFLAVAADLSVDPGVLPPPVKEPRPVPERDLRRLMRLLCLWPGADALLAEWLRQRHCPEVPPQGLLQILAGGLDPTFATMRFSPEELSQLIDELRVLEPGRDEVVRQDLLRVLNRSKPAEGSAAHLYWQRDCALQEIYIHDADGSFGTMRRAVARLSSLARGVLWPDLLEDLGRLGVPGAPRPLGKPTVPIAPPVARELERDVVHLVVAMAEGRGPLKGQGGSPSLPPPGGPWPWPSWQELAFGASLAAACWLGVWGLGLVPRELREHRQLYQLKVVAHDESGATLLVRGLPGAPRDAKLVGLKDENRSVTLRADSTAEVRLPTDPQPRLYHIRAPLDGPRLAHSNQVRVPGQALPAYGQLNLHFISRKGQDLGPVPYRVTDSTGQSRNGHAGQPLRVRAGTEAISAQVPGYEAVAQDVQVPENETYTLSIIDEGPPIEMDTRPARLTLKIFPPLVPKEVRINGVPWDGRVLSLQPGRVRMAIDSPYYDPPKGLTLGPGEDKTYAFPAQPVYWVVRLRVKAPIFGIGSTMFGGVQFAASRIAAPGTRVTVLPTRVEPEFREWRGQDQGMIHVVLTAPGYQSKEVELPIQPGRTETQELELQLVPEVRTGTVLVSAEAGAEVLVDGLPRGLVPAVVHNLGEGEHEVEVHRALAPPWKKTVRVVAGQDTRVPVDPLQPSSSIPVPGKMVLIRAGKVRVGEVDHRVLQGLPHINLTGVADRTKVVDKYKTYQPHEVDLGSYWMDITEVTVAAYRDCVEKKQCKKPYINVNESCNWGRAGREDHPINCVDWNEARNYCQKVGKRLPTEKEWEYAARGPKGWIYPWGNEWSAKKACIDHRGGTCKAGQFQDGAFGLKDMAGNVEEWTESNYCEDYSLNTCSDSSHHVVRGGSWHPDEYDGQQKARADYREYFGGALPPRYWFDYLGFRCAGHPWAL